MTPSEFLEKWTTEADAMQRRGVTVSGASLLAEVLADFRAAVASEAETVLPLSAAAARSGYSEEHLGRLVREGKVPNAGRKGAPRIRLADLPRKPGSLAPAGPKAYDPNADARTLLSRQRGGTNG